jgi:glucose-1-phosphate thymidylyltransferase
MKGVVLSGGAGTRLRPITFSMAKQLVPVGNKPILFYGLEDIASAGVKEVGIIISPETGDEVRRAVGDGTRFGLESVEFIVQDRPAGLAHALKTALPWVGGDDVLMYLGDNLLKPGVAKIVADFERDRPNCQILLTPVPDPTAFGVAEVDGGGRVVRLVEKPKDPPSNLALVGVYLFDGTIAEAVDSIKPSARGELEITDAIQWLVEHGKDVRHSVVRGWWKDTGKKDDLLHANELLLTNISEEVRGELVDCTIRGAIQVAEGARLVDCVVTGPAVIGRGAQLTRVSVGPNTAIGDGCRLSDAAVEDSIIMEGAEVHAWRVRNSLLGRDSHLHGTAPPGFVEMTLGEKSEIFGE